MNYAEIENKIRMIEAQPGSYVGGAKAFASGNKVELTAAAHKQIAALEKKLAAMVDDSLDD